MKDENENIPFNNVPGNFGLPEGYFQKSASSIFNKMEWQEEHKDFSKLLALKETNPGSQNGFIVPQNYFADNEECLENVQYPNLMALRKTSGFSVPENYFAEKEMEELAGVMDDRQEELFAFEKLRSIKKQNNFTVGEDYFSKNEKEIKSLLEQPKTGQGVTSLFTRRVAFAGAALLILSLGFWVYDFYFSPVELKDCGTMACVDKHDLVKTKNLEGLDNDELYELVNPKDLEKKLEIKENKKDGQVKDSSLKNVSTDDLLDEI